MLGKLENLTMNRDGTQKLTITLQNDIRELFDELLDKEVDVEIKKHSNRRSLDANNLCWSIIDQIAAKTKTKKSEVYRNAIKDIGGVSDIVCVRNFAVDKLIKGWTSKGVGWQAETEPSRLPGCTNVTLYYGSSVFDSKQMSALIDSLIQDAHALGIVTAAQSEIQKAIEFWSKKDGVDYGR